MVMQGMMYLLLLGTTAKLSKFSQNSFMDLKLSRPLLLACQRLGFTKPSPIQAVCLPLAMTGRDIRGIAITGSGKTAAFALPTLERLLIRPKPEQVPGIRVLVSTPTRERCLQVLSMIEELAQFTDISCCQADGELSSKYNHIHFSVCGTKVAAHRLKIIFGLVGRKAAELHANLLQVERLHVQVHRSSIFV